MKALIGSLALLAATTAVGVAAQTAPSQHVRGTIVSVGGGVLTVQAGAARKRVDLTNKTSISLVGKSSLDQIKPGAFVGSAAVPQPDGTLKAQDVMIFPETMRGTGEGHYAWDLTPHSTMTNATVQTVASGAASVKVDLLTLHYTGGQQTIKVPANAPVVKLSAADKRALKRGAHVFIVASPKPDGTLVADFVAVGKNGLTPPM
ncbi:MAG: hypothetical protein ACREM6_07270 [Vulcanimicrobiaceae bacterium]